MDSSSRKKKQSKGGGSMVSTFYSYDNGGNLKEKNPSSGSIWGLRNYKKQIKNTTQSHHQEVDHSNKEEEKEEERNKKIKMKKFVVEARKSVSHVESNLTSVASFLNVKVLAVDMPGFMQVHAFRCARRTFDSLEKFSSKHMAYHMKKEFDRVYGPAWHCIVGSSFGSFVTYSTGCFIYFSMEKIYILVFKTKVQKASE